MRVKRLAWATGAMLGLAPCVVSAQTSTSITIRGYVPTISSLQLLETNPVISNDLRTSVTGALVARVLEQSNAASGYLIKLISETGRSRNGAALLNREHGVAIPYILSYGGERIQFANGEAEIKRPRRAKAERKVESDLRISTNGNERAPTGEYSDTITLVIAAR